MPKPSTKVEFNTFVKGLITEASPLNFPPNASLDEENFELNRDGSRQRRRGVAFENAYSLIPTTLSLAAISATPPVTHRWAEVAGDVTKNFIVIQAASTLYFFDMAEESMSTDGAIGSITLTGFPSDTRYSLSSIDGFLVVAAGVDTVAVVSYDNPGFSASYERLIVRDLWGVEV
jgi:hypothetical protein